MRCSLEGQKEKRTAGEASRQGAEFIAFVSLGPSSYRVFFLGGGERGK